MKPFISTSFYGVMNYVLSFSLLLSPWFVGSYHGVTGFYTVGGAALFLPLLYGWLEFIMAVFSANKHGFIRFFPMQMHWFLDVVIGSFLLASPFVYGFYDKVVWPQVILGLLLCIFGVFTKGSPFTTAIHHQLPEGQLGSTASTEGRLTH